MWICPEEFHFFWPQIFVGKPWQCVLICLVHQSVVSVNEWQNPLGLRSHRVSPSLWSGQPWVHDIAMAPQTRHTQTHRHAQDPWSCTGSLILPHLYTLIPTYICTMHLQFHIFQILLIQESISFLITKDNLGWTTGRVSWQEQTEKWVTCICAYPRGK